MKKLNSIVYNKLLLQAEEAKDRDMVKLATGILNSIGAMPEEEQHNYNYNELQEDVYKELWKAAAYIIKYHDVNSADAEKIHDTLESLASKIIEEVENSLGVDDTKIGPFEDDLPGQVK